MLNHIMIGSNDIQRTKGFYNAVLGVLGASEPMEHVNDTGQTRLCYIHDGSTFSVSEPINGQPDRYEQIRNQGLEMAVMIKNLTPESREQALAITSLEQAVMWANAAIARREKA